MLRVVRATPAKLQLVAGLILCAGLWAAVNWIYHAVHKPTELLFPVSNALNKTPPETWREYESHLRLRLVPAFGRLKLRQLTRARIEAYVAREHAAGWVGAKTINNSLVARSGTPRRTV